ncbi:hypothetical protein MMC31_004946 [Peltigera leucophlebia]|nr:hypothetical protein [Peltigera leucophlebia]
MSSHSSSMPSQPTTLPLTWDWALVSEEESSPPEICEDWYMLGEDVSQPHPGTANDQYQDSSDWSSSASKSPGGIELPPSALPGPIADDAPVLMAGPMFSNNFPFGPQPLPFGSEPATYFLGQGPSEFPF